MFPVAGYGTRFLPATKSMPKEMLPIVNKPLVQYGVEEAIEAGMTTCALVTGPRQAGDRRSFRYQLRTGAPDFRHLEGGLSRQHPQRPRQGRVHDGAPA
jgi:NDP-sugar pyrophosphorylase family protein